MGIEREGVAPPWRQREGISGKVEGQRKGRGAEMEHK